jgi:integrase
MPYYKNEPQSVIENSLYHDRTTHNNRPDIVLLHKTIKEEYLIYAAIPNSHNLHSTFTDKLQNYTDLIEELTNHSELQTTYIIALVLSTSGVIPNELHESLKLINRSPALYIVMQKAVIFHACLTVSYWQKSE